VDLAKYCVNAVLVEGRSVRAVAAATGRSKSWVHRHVAFYQAGRRGGSGSAQAGPKVPANLTSAALEDEIVAWRKRLARRPRRRGPDHRLAPEPEGGEVPALSTIHRVLGAGGS
jgi:hypothetical protein